jgi:uncharacterized protein YgbK (DUF1537 family)
MGGDAILRAYGEAETLMAASPGLCIVAVESMFKAGIPEGDVARDTEDGGAISAALGSLAEKLLGRFRFPVLITTGGDTSLSVCGKLGVTGIEPVAELCPGIPLGRIAGGAYEGRYIITKSGRFGRRDSLMEIWNYLNKPAGVPAGGR